MSRKEPLQRSIIMYLARTRPQTINETAKGISKDYKSSWVAFKKLEKKGLIKIVGQKRRRGNEYPYFWLTEVGISQALEEGANPEHLFNQTLEIYPQNRNLQFLIEAVPIFGNIIANEFGSDISGNRKKVETGLTILMSVQIMDVIDHDPEMQETHSQEQITKLRTLLKKYPQFYRRLPNELEQYAEGLRKVVNLLQQENRE